MSERICERVRMAAMAARDGELEDMVEAREAPPAGRQSASRPLTQDEVAEHVRQCAACRREIERLDEVLGALDGRQRQPCEEDLWPAIAERLAREPGARRGRGALVVLGVLLAACRVLDQTPGLELSVALKLVPVVLAAGAFAWLRANPFRIDPNVHRAAQHDFASQGEALRG